MCFSAIMNLSCFGRKENISRKILIHDIIRSDVMVRLRIFSNFLIEFERAATNVHQASGISDIMKIKEKTQPS